MEQKYNLGSYLRTGTVLRHRIGSGAAVIGGAYHYAVFVNEKIGTVGFSQNPETQQGVLEVISLRSREWEVVTDIPQLLEPKVIEEKIKAAFKRFKQSGEAPQYDVKTYNCEHWATEMVADTPDSKQARERLVLLLKSGGVAGVAGAAAGPAVMGLVMSFAAASTGTAISTLSGAAATNAALAWLGGGAIAAGGSGMAAGAIVLSGLVTGGAAIAAIGVGFVAWKALSQGQSRKVSDLVAEFIGLLKQGELKTDLAMSGVDPEKNAKEAVQSFDKAYYLGASFAHPSELLTIQAKCGELKDEFPNFFEPTQWDIVMGGVNEKMLVIGGKAAELGEVVASNVTEHATKIGGKAVAAGDAVSREAAKHLLGATKRFMDWRTRG